MHATMQATHLTHNNLKPSQKSINLSEIWGKKKTLKYKANFGEIYSVSSTCFFPSKWLYLSFISTRQMSLWRLERPPQLEVHHRTIDGSKTPRLRMAAGGRGGGGVERGGVVVVVGGNKEAAFLPGSALFPLCTKPQPPPLQYQEHANNKQASRHTHTPMPLQLCQWGPIKHTPKQLAAFTQACSTRLDERVRTVRIRAVYDVIWWLVIKTRCRCHHETPGGVVAECWRWCGCKRNADLLNNNVMWYST